MATIALAAARAVKTMYGTTLVEQDSAEAATQTFKRGNFLDDNAAGFLRIIAADNAADLVGIATRDGRNGTAAGDHNSRFIPLFPGLVVEMNFYGAADGAHVLAQTDLWVGYQYQRTGTDNHSTIDETLTTPRFVVVRLALDPTGTFGAIGDSNARVWAVPTGSACAITPDA